MTETPNAYLREHVTSTAFSLTLTKRQMDFLILLYHFRGNFTKAHNHTYEAKRAGRHNAARPLDSMWVANSQSLTSRGLLTPGPGNWSLTKAGNLVVGLLKEAGIYQDRIEDLGLTTKKDKAA